MVDEDRLLVQKGTRVYLLHFEILWRDLLYQQVLRQTRLFSSIDDRIDALGLYSFEPGLSLRDLAMCALEAEEAKGTWQDSELGGSKEDISSLLETLLIQRSPVLNDCFGIVIRDDGFIECMPKVIDKAALCLEKLPAMILSFAQHVDWNSPTYFEAIAHIIAQMYAFDGDIAGKEAALSGLIPTKRRASDGSIIELTRLETLYKIFERC